MSFDLDEHINKAAEVARTADPIADAALELEHGIKRGYVRTYISIDTLRALIALAKRAMPLEEATPGGWRISRVDGFGVWESIHGHQRYIEAVTRLERERVAFTVEPM